MIGISELTYESCDNNKLGVAGDAGAIGLRTWEPTTSLRTGMKRTYRWIYDQYMARERGDAGVLREFLTASNKT